MAYDDYDRSSYRDADVGETYSESPRVISTYQRATYSRLIQVADNINFNSPIFDGMSKRNRSLGSAQAFIVELALADQRFVEENLKPFMIGEGINLLLGTHYLDTIYYDRLEAYNKEKSKKVQNISPSSPTPSSTTAKKNKRVYFNSQ